MALFSGVVLIALPHILFRESLGMSVQSYIKGLGFGLGMSCSYSLTAILIRLVLPDAPISILLWYASFGNILVYLVVYYGETEGYIITGNRPISFEYTSSRSSPSCLCCLLAMTSLSLCF